MQWNNPQPPPTRPRSPHTNPAVFLSVHLSSSLSSPAHPVLRTFQFNHIYAGVVVVVGREGPQHSHGGDADEIVVSSEAHVYVYRITCGHAVNENEKCRLSSLKLIQRKATLISTNWPKEQLHLFLSTLFWWMIHQEEAHESNRAAPLLRWRSGKLKSDCVTGPIRLISEARGGTKALTLL